jgi:hypothetical protein
MEFPAIGWQIFTAESPENGRSVRGVDCGNASHVHAGTKRNEGLLIAG